MRQPGFVLFKMREGPCWAPQQGPALVHGGPNKQKRGPALRLKLIDLHRPRNPRLLMSCRARHVLGHQRGRERGPATARRGGASASGTPEWKRRRQIRRQKNREKMREKICGNPGRISGPRNVGDFFRFLFRRRFSALAERGCAPPLRVRRARISGLLPRAVGGGARAPAAVQETSVTAGSRPLSTPGRAAWTGARLLFSGDFSLYIVSAVH